MLSSQRVGKGWLLICSWGGGLAPHAFIILSVGHVSLRLGREIEKHCGALVQLFLAPLKSSVLYWRGGSSTPLKAMDIKLVQVIPIPKIPRLSLLRVIGGGLGLEIPHRQESFCSLGTGISLAPIL